MKPISRTSLIDFELWAMTFAEACEVKSKEDLEELSAKLHEHLETAMVEYAWDEGIVDYDPQY